jgi:L-seryl-tRNA(Ser) seleniumtransferase
LQDVSLRDIPSIDHMRQRSSVRALEVRFGSAAVVDALRDAASAVRGALARGESGGSSALPLDAQLEALAQERLEAAFRPSLEPVINATGVILHTNLGRAPLADAVIDRLAEIAPGYSTLEYDPSTGARGHRDVHAEPLLQRLTGAEAAVVVNNNAAATLVLLAALAAGREVIVSRGELVEIGGGFRIPDVLNQSGAVLREVGATNRTRAADYAAAVTERTALILRVHPSNFRIEGFAERPGLDELVEVGRRLGVPVAEDLGSGSFGLSPLGNGPTAVEPTVQDAIAAGVDICCFSGDKLLGGPQAGIVVGRTTLVERVRRHPLMRALRVDKLTYAALEATLQEYAAGRATNTVPVQRMLGESAETIKARASAVARALSSTGHWHTDVVPGASAVGGGSAPGFELPTWLLVVGRDGIGPDALEERLRQLEPPIIARIDRDRVVLDLRTVLPAQDELLLRLLRDDIQTRTKGTS